MSRYLTFHGIDLNAIHRSWLNFYPERYAVSADLLEENTTNHPMFDWGCSLVLMDGSEVAAFVAVKKSASPHLFLGPDPDQAHITALAFRDPVQMVDVLASVKSSLKQRGVFNLVFGSDHGHFFPGAPLDCPVLRNFLEIEGFQLSETVAVDLERDLIDYQVPEWVKAALESVAIRRASVEDLPGLDAFLGETFPGRWRYDVRKRSVNLKRPQDIVIMEVDGSIQGFALIQDSSYPLPIGGGVWHLSMGENWGSLGPIGIGESVRGRKLGHAMLAGALMELKKSGVRRCIIDWTTLRDFYGAHGFEVTRVYSPAVLGLR